MRRKQAEYSGGHFMFKCCDQVGQILIYILLSKLFETNLNFYLAHVKPNQPYLLSPLIET